MVLLELQVLNFVGFYECVRFKVFVSLLLDQFVRVSPRLVGPYNGGGGFQVL